MKTRYDSGATGHHFKEGDQVWMYNPKRRRGLCPKLQQNWEGPYTIVKKLNDVIYRVQRSPNAKPKQIVCDAKMIRRDLFPLRIARQYQTDSSVLQLRASVDGRGRAVVNFNEGIFKQRGTSSALL
ncbi:hypothetical protein AVEN_72693-1 [Araneus ventricosus]|uniref:Integrase p58-like C-terminal domain-containing protein n=1 Tax=Araneus ventricosus TaxID=182803 RepID=A0A4Y2CSC0_ARAVE|nr:hypothetical protein AVEN_72693-1 [Araneus ventricosus]